MLHVKVGIEREGAITFLAISDRLIDQKTGGGWRVTLVTLHFYCVLSSLSQSKEEMHIGMNFSQKSSQEVNA